MKLTSKISVTILFIISIIGLFLPWFFFSKTEDYSNGLSWLNIGMIIGYLGTMLTSIIIWIKKGTVDTEWANFVFMILILVSTIYEFFTWHIETITGSMNIRISIEYTHYGFYVTLISTIFAITIYSYNIIRKRI